MINNMLIEAVKLNQPVLVKYLINQGADITVCGTEAVRWAARNGHLETVKLLIEAGADVTADDNWAVRWAVRNGHLEVFKLLLTYFKGDLK